jgi:hypothetical protein
LFARATGYLGYTPQEALSANVNDLQIALEGRFELLGKLFGKSSPDDQPRRRPMSASRFRDMARQHNAKVSRSPK